MLELDVVLAQFLARHDGALTLAEREAFSALLELPDPVLWDLIIGKAQSDNTRLARILEWLRAA
ncbi:MAG TPA: succinate dehydrogenase assembly factor 2 [Betaproteobacteria bacterium]|nr:succinate dehydrogenase assembly factor 2 [Betaproteobacteria bacterium]